jgi:hypothetical protein
VLLFETDRCRQTCGLSGWLQFIFALQRDDERFIRLDSGGSVAVVVKERHQSAHDCFIRRQEIGGLSRPALCVDQLSLGRRGLRQLPRRLGSELPKSYTLALHPALELRRARHVEAIEEITSIE